MIKIIRVMAICSGAFQLGGKSLPDEEEECLAAALPLPYTINLSLRILTSISTTFVKYTHMFT